MFKRFFILKKNNIFKKKLDIKKIIILTLIELSQCILNCVFINLLTNVTGLDTNKNQYNNDERID